MGLQVIGAGLGRTGTLSLKSALEILGFPCFHMVDLMERPHLVGQWDDAWAGRPVDWDALLDGFTAIVDFPGCVHWRALAARYPEAKVVLSVRDPDAWYESTFSTIFPSSRDDRLPPDPPNPLPMFVWRTIWQGFFEGRFRDRAFAIARFHEHNDAVRREIPPERLLEIEVGAGWTPLCRFLGVPEPGVPYPKVNSREEFQGRVLSRASAPSSSS